MMWTTLGLSRDPFDRCPELDDACLPNTMASALSELMSDLRTSHGVSIVTAEPGSGKSIVVAAFARRLAVTADVAVIDKPPSSLSAIARAALDQLDAGASRGDGDRDWTSVLQESIAASAADGRSTAIVIDDAHRLSPQTLEDLSLLFGDGRSSRLHLFLFGRPRVVERLNAASGHALDDHLLQVIELDPLSLRESVRYLERRIAICGGELLRLYDETAIDEIVQRAGGGMARLEEIAVEALKRATGRGAARALVRDVVATARRASDAREEDVAPGRQQPLRFALSDEAREEQGEWHVGDEHDSGSDAESWDDDTGSHDEWQADDEADDEELSWDASAQHEEIDVDLDEGQLEEEDDDFDSDESEDQQDERFLEAVAKPASARRRLVGPAVVSLAAGLSLVWAANQIPGPASQAQHGRDAVLFAEPLASEPTEILRLAATAEEADADAQVQAWRAQPRPSTKPATPEQIASASPPSSPSSAGGAPSAKDSARPREAPAAAEATPRPATPAATAAAKPASPVATGKVAAAGPAAKSPAKTASKALAKAAVAKAASREPVYTVQLGAFKARRNAEELATKLRYKPTHILQEGGLYRVVSGSFRSKRDAASHEAKLKQAGYSTYVRTAVF